MITIHGYSPSGNCHKLRMLLGHLGREHRWVETDSAHGATRTAEYLAKNPNGKVPMLETEDGRILVESNAILVWLAEGTRYFAGDAWQRAQIQSGPTTQNHPSTPGHDVCDRSIGGLCIACCRRWFICRKRTNQVMRNPRLLFLRWLGGQKRESGTNLQRVTSHNLGLKIFCQAQRQRRLARGRWTDDHQQRQRTQQTRGKTGGQAIHGRILRQPARE